MITAAVAVMVMMQVPAVTKDRVSVVRVAHATRYVNVMIRVMVIAMRIARVAAPV